MTKLLEFFTSIMSCRSLTYVFSVIDISRHTICSFDIDILPWPPPPPIFPESKGVVWGGVVVLRTVWLWEILRGWSFWSSSLSSLLLLLSFNSIIDWDNKNSALFSKEKFDSSMATLCMSGVWLLSKDSTTVVEMEVLLCLLGDRSTSIVSLLILKISFRSSLEKEVAVGVTMVLNRSLCDKCWVRQWWSYCSTW